MILRKKKRRRQILGELRHVSTSSPEFLHETFTRFCNHFVEKLELEILSMTRDITYLEDHIYKL
jgi:hypothetical protein